ncbi:MAG: D-alanine--D-alanine ligase [Gammaproteobacteria bacterium]|nr:D-alanine--D-alanine ligase [Gammaproteobacteria bacterium]NIM73023.1 D-alanine--D-alanine ligase [Gammaproteobacteria bacterium]NIN38639.1 D-alanine--D-alanine ligase [Gammaproteobacteria bacterium]NIO24775.1 D-alanine--D-alanine ligase [Gammaproteobacteria bacterium]NIO65378.1 D-alanine--D-alanine ligase [Gammaproteobacteria bacterium]
MPDKRLRVGVLFGGRSAEHEVSVRSGLSIMAAMDRGKYELVPIGVTKSGEWLRLDPRLLEGPGAALALEGDRVALLPQPKDHSLMRLDNGADGARKPLDVVFPVLHGPLGEDGTVQGLLELADIPYVGSGVLGSAVGMDKAAMKALFRERQLKIAPYRVFLRKRWRDNPEAVRTECESAFPYPWFVKPANLGSSVGISKVRDEAEFVTAMEEAAQYDRKLIVEAAVEHAREVEVSVLGNDEPVASVVGEILPSHEFYDYESKYLDDATRLVIPADLPESMADTVRETAVQAFLALDCAGLARVDFLIAAKTLEVFLSEVNTMPGFTSVSMYPKLWEASGVPYSELIDKLIALAIERHAEIHANRRSYTD